MSGRLHPYAASEHLDDTLAYRQSESGAGDEVVEFGEAREEPLGILIGNSYSGVTHIEIYLIVTQLISECYASIGG